MLSKYYEIKLEIYVKEHTQEILLKMKHHELKDTNSEYIHFV